MMNNDLREASGERWRRAARAAEAKDLPKELRRSRCTRMNNNPNFSIHGQQSNWFWRDSRLNFILIAENPCGLNGENLFV